MSEYQIKDGYEEFFKAFNISHDDLIRFGLESILFCNKEIAKLEWDKLKRNISDNKEVYIRGYGRDAKGTQMFIELYKELLNNENVLKDSTNNDRPTKVIQEWTGYIKDSKTKNKNKKIISNYQVSHVFGKTKNPYLFTAPFNVIFIPKIMDPFTGHEASGDIVEKFTKQLKEKAFREFKTIIEDYNSIVGDKLFKEKLTYSISEIKNRYKSDIDESILNKFEKIALSEFEKIEL